MLIKTPLQKKIRIFELRMKGYSYQDISTKILGDEFGEIKYSPDDIEHILDELSFEIRNYYFESKE